MKRSLLNINNNKSSVNTFGGAPLGSVKIVLKYDHRNNTSMMWYTRRYGTDSSTDVTRPEDQEGQRIHIKIDYL